MSAQSKNLNKHQKLIMQHAYYSDLIKDLKYRGGVESGLCFGVDTKDNTLGDKPFATIIGGDYRRISCIQNAINWMNDSHDDDGGLSTTFDDFFEEADAEGLVCQHCHEVRRLKSERMKAIAHLGAVRAAMTKMGRKLAEVQA